MWQLLLSWLILGKQYSLRQIAGASIFILGVMVLAGIPHKGTPDMMPRTYTNQYGLVCLADTVFVLLAVSWTTSAVHYCFNDG